MSPCNLDQERKGNAVDELEKILLTYGITLAQPKDGLGVSNIGAPAARPALNMMREKGMLKLFLARGITILAAIILFILSLLSENMGASSGDILRPLAIASSQTLFEAIFTIFLGYIFIPMTVIFLSVEFLYFDYFLLTSSKKARTIFPWDWFVLSLILIILAGLVYGFVVETTILHIMFLSQDASGTNMFILYGFGLMIITLPYTLKVFIVRYVSWTNSIHYRIDKKVKAVRECLLAYSSFSSTTSSAASEEIIRNANHRITMVILMRALVGAGILIFLMPFIWLEIGQFVIFDIVFQIIFGAIAIVISSILFWILRKALLACDSDLEQIAGSILMLTYLIALPFSYLSSGIFVSIILIGFGFLSSMVLLLQGAKLSKECPSLLGYSYYTELLENGNNDENWNFIRETLDELNILLKENYLLL